MDNRYRKLLKTLIERYIVEGHPVGSRSLAKFSDLDISAATIRNVMADLEEMGLVESPHISAGRVPTIKGFRLFVDSLLTLSEIEKKEAAIIRDTFRDDVPEEVMTHAADLLSKLSKFAGVVTTTMKSQTFKHLEFVKLNEKRILLILVTPEGEVLNRIFTIERRFSESQLVEASNYLTTSFSGLSFSQVRERLNSELKILQRDLSILIIKAIEEGGAVLRDAEGKVVISGRNQLLDVSELSKNSARLKNVYHLLEQKTGIVKLLESISKAKGVRIFIGGESALMPESSLSVVASSVVVEGFVVGTLGVIGPTRMAYDRVVPIF